MKWGNKGTIVCFALSGLFIYGKYFVAETPIDTLRMEFYFFMWIILGFLFILNNQLNDIKKKIK